MYLLYKNGILRIIISLIVGINLFDFSNIFPISIISILSGYKFESFYAELLISVLIAVIYIIFIAIMKHKIIYKKGEL